MIWIVYILNLAISAFNAWSCGRSWTETKQMGGLAHFMNWMGAIMSASGFTWCYLVLITKLGVMIPGEYHLPEPWAEGVFQLGYLIIIVPIIGSGLAITIQSWAYFWKERNFTNGAIAGWNTFADIYNIASAMKGIPSALSGLGNLFSGGEAEDDDDSPLGSLVVYVVVGLAILAVLGGVVTTTWIIRATARSVALEEKVRVLEAKQAARGTDNRRWA